MADAAYQEIEQAKPESKFAVEAWATAPEAGIKPAPKSAGYSSDSKLYVGLVFAAVVAGLAAWYVAAQGTPSGEALTATTASAFHPM